MGKDQGSVKIVSAQRAEKAQMVQTVEGERLVFPGEWIVSDARNRCSVFPPADFSKKHLSFGQALRIAGGESI